MDIQSEARSIAVELLEELFEDVCKPKGGSRDVDDVSCSKPLISDPKVDLGELLADEPVVTAFTMRDSKMKVTQLKCVEQKKSGYCGHYAVFFSKVLLEACHSKDEEEARDWLALTRDSVSLWKRYWETVNILNQRALTQQQWPWTVEHVHKGDMERSFLAHLLSSDPFFKTFSSSHIVVLQDFYAYGGLIHDSGEEVCTIQKRITEFRQSSEQCIVFILGVLNHWVTLVFYKTASNGTSDVGVLYLDSCNDSVLLASDDHLEEIVAKGEEKHIKKKNKPYTEWERETYLQSLKDRRNVLKLLWGCLAGTNDLRSELLTSSWYKMIDSYEHYICSILQESTDSGLYTVLLLQWLEKHYHIRNMNKHLRLLDTFGLAFPKEPVISRVTGWVQHCLQFLGDEEDETTGIDSVDNFRVCVHKVLATLDSIVTVV